MLSEDKGMQGAHWAWSHSLAVVGSGSHNCAVEAVGENKDISSCPAGTWDMEYHKTRKQEES